MTDRTIEDRLREEYFDLLPDIRRVANQLEAEVKYHTLSISRTLDRHERLHVTSRIKECGSALDALRRRQEGATFDSDQPELYTLSALRDLAGIRILAFPRRRLAEIDQVLREQFPSWKSDPVRDENEHVLAHKYYGYCAEASKKVQGEYQIVSMLTGLFWEVEHSAIYKPTPSLKGIARSLEMQQRTKDVLSALRRFEEEFERFGHAGNNPFYGAPGILDRIPLESQWNSEITHSAAEESCPI